MIDETFVHRLQELRHSGDKETFKDEFTRHGGWERILSLAEIGATQAPRKRTPRQTTPKDEHQGFEAFYAAFPHHVARRAAAKAYARAVTIATEEQILAGARRYADECKETEPKFIKHPATWLNAECWADQPKTLLRVVGGTAAAGSGNWDINQEG
jgi:hypothetical protein